MTETRKPRVTVATMSAEELKALDDELDLMGDDLDRKVEVLLSSNDEKVSDHGYNLAIRNHKRRGTESVVIDGKEYEFSLGLLTLQQRVRGLPEGFWMNYDGARWVAGFTKSLGSEYGTSCEGPSPQDAWDELRFELYVQFRCLKSDYNAVLRGIKSMGHEESK